MSPSPRFLLLACALFPTILAGLPSNAAFLPRRLGQRQPRQVTVLVKFVVHCKPSLGQLQSAESDNNWTVLAQLSPPDGDVQRVIDQLASMEASPAGFATTFKQRLVAVGVSWQIVNDTFVLKTFATTQRPHAATTTTTTTATTTTATTVGTTTGATSAITTTGSVSLSATLTPASGTRTTTSTYGSTSRALTETSSSVAVHGGSTSTVASNAAGSGGESGSDTGTSTTKSSSTLKLMASPASSPMPWLHSLLSCCLLAVAAAEGPQGPLLAGSSTESPIDYDFAGKGSVDAVLALLRRTLQFSSDEPLPFHLEMVSACQGEKPAAARSNLCFELSDLPGSGSGVLVRGTSGVDLARGAGHYLRAFCNMSFSWARSGGNQVHLPSSWPRVGKQPVVQWRLRDISYGFNVCTFSYSNVWYAFNDTLPGVENWESLIDWMALSGINLALAYTGQEEVYRKVYSQFGVNATAFAAWSNGPAHLTWSRGQSMHGVGGPLPQVWMRSQWLLQRHILQRLRDLGIIPVLPAFQGNVPPLLATLYPTANITLQKAHWGGGTAAWLDATDPLFQAIGDKFMRQLVADFGIDTDGDGVGDVTDHWYEADGYFAAGDPPWLARSARRALRGVAAAGEAHFDQNAFTHASKAYLAMNTTDPKAVWLYQGWILGDSSHDLEVMRGYAAAVPRGRLVVSDMWAEWRPISGMLAEAGVPYLYGVLQNFGGTLYLGMSIAAINSGSPEDPEAVPSVFKTFATREGGVGIGAFPEGIDQNPAYFTYFFDANWMSAQTDLSAWWSRYALQRYGAESAHAARAWAALGATVYGIDERKGATEGGFWREKAKGGLLSAPLLHDTSDTPSHAWYNVSDVLGAWMDLVAASRELPRGTELGTLRYDTANMGREVLDRVADIRFAALAAAKDPAAVAEAGQKLLEVHEDADQLLCTEPGLCLHTWLDAAQALGNADGGEASFYDRMARAQLTTWLPSCVDKSEAADGVCSIHLTENAPPLEDYANKAWGGLVSHFYAGRVKCYLAHWHNDAVKAVNVTGFDECIDDLAYSFQHDTNRTQYPLCPAPRGDTFDLSDALIKKYRGDLLLMLASSAQWTEPVARAKVYI